MFIVNFKLDAKKIILTTLIIASIVATIIEFSTDNIKTVNSNLDSNYDYTFTDENYTTLLNQIHTNIDENIGKTVKITGFVFKMPDFKENYFVCGRNVISNGEDSVAGILCSYNDSSKLVDNEWLEVTGVIIKGDYNGDMPIIKVGNVQKIIAPSNTFVENITNVNSNK